MSTFNDQAGLKELVATATRIRGAMESVIEGKPEVVRLALTVLLAEGHLLVEDVPGVGKTMLAKSLARSVDCSVRRVQFTPDLLPSDITGVSVYDQERREFEFKPGAIFANIVVGDEINRASPKTQSALLECMAERQVTVDGTTYELQSPFMVIATQNPVEMEGTYPLPEAQRDRFMARVSMGYPSPEAELEMLGVHGTGSPLDSLDPVADARDIVKLIEAVREVHVSPGVARYAVDLVNATRNSAELRLGASPRATLHLIRAARAAAALDNRNYVLPDDLQALAVPVLAHRLLPTAEAQMSRRSVEQVVLDLVRLVPVPGGQDGRPQQQAAARPAPAPVPNPVRAAAPAPRQPTMQAPQPGYAAQPGYGGHPAPYAQPQQHQPQQQPYPDQSGHYGGAPTGPFYGNGHGPAR
ncbi:AAA family ATPase [Yinghuangia seranimata]|uniref:AAA family ATPase n=1 Tax=Yinghuangia seranimata TaxID=408067 RepID=UPI00248C4067|nr:AAA family ATPase [Yinghuangia seranimata]MDI2126179.1 AAA family ATPase [Yinghuangia seranimata]